MGKSVPFQNLTKKKKRNIIKICPDLGFEWKHPIELDSQNFVHKFQFSLISRHILKEFISPLPNNPSVFYC